MTLATLLEQRTLNDGTAVTIRPIAPEDGPQLQAFHTRLALETIYGRYLCAHPVLSAAEAEQLTTIDYDKRMAFVATVTEGRETGLIGVACYERLGAGHADEAEAAIVVEDRYQGRGAGTILLHRLADHARAHGIRTFVAEISAERDRLLDFVRRSGLGMHSKLEGGVWEIRVRIT